MSGARALLAVVCFLAACGGAGRGGAAREHAGTASRDVARPPAAALPRAAETTETGRRDAILVLLHRGDVPGARAAVAHWPGDSSVRRAVVARVDAARSSPLVAARVGLIVPLSGRFGALGVAVRDGVTLAFEEEAPDLELVVWDSKGDSALAVRGVEALDRAGALFALGPVGELEARAAATRAAALGLPLCVLAPVEGLEAPTAGVLRLMTAETELARDAARLAVAEGLTRLAVLYPRDQSGAAQATAFTNAARAAGAEVVAAGSYDPMGEELASDVTAFLGIDPARNAALRRHLARHGDTKTFVPEVPFELLFIPDRIERVGLLLSFLVYHNVAFRTPDLVSPEALARRYGGQVPTQVQLLGGPGWRTPELLVHAGDSALGAWVVDVFAGGTEAEASWPGAAEFGDRFEARFGHAPTALAAQAYDAARLAIAGRRLAAQGGAPARDTFVRAMLRARIGRGPTGPTGMGPHGAVVRRPLVLLVDDDGARVERLGLE